MVSLGAPLRRHATVIHSLLRLGRLPIALRCAYTRDPSALRRGKRRVPAERCAPCGAPVREPLEEAVGFNRGEAFTACAPGGRAPPWGDPPKKRAPLPALPVRQRSLGSCTAQAATASKLRKGHQTLPPVFCEPDTTKCNKKAIFSYRPDGAQSVRGGEIAAPAALRARD